MANLISVAGAVGRDRDRREREPTVMEQVLQGLQIANGVYGLKSKYDDNQRADEQMDLSKKADARGEDANRRAADEEARKAAADSRKLKGIVLPEEAAEMNKAFIMSKVQPKDSSNSVALTIQGEKEPTWFTPRVKTDAPDLVAVKKRDEDGKLYEEYVPKAAGVKSEISELSPAALEAKQRGFNDSVIKFSEKTEPLNRTFNAIGNVEKELGFNLDDYDPRTDTVIQKNQSAVRKDLPGASIPVIGRVSFYNKDARTLQATMEKVFNVELKDRSGAAVTNQELERLRIEFQNGRYTTEAEMIGALKRYKEAAAELLNNLEAPYRGISDVEGKSVVDRLDQYGGFTSRKFTKAMEASPEQTAPAAPQYTDEERAKAQEILRQRGRWP